MSSVLPKVPIAGDIGNCPSLTTRQDIGFAIFFIGAAIGGGFLIAPGINAMSTFAPGTSLLTIDFVLIVYALKRKRTSIVFTKECEQAIIKRLLDVYIEDFDGPGWPEKMVVFQGFFPGDSSFSPQELMDDIFKNGRVPTGTMHAFDEDEGAKPVYQEQITIDTTTGRHNGLVATSCSLEAAIPYAFNSMLKTSRAINDEAHPEPLKSEKEYKGWVFFFDIRRSACESGQLKAVNITARVPENPKVCSEQELAFVKIPGNLIIGALPITFLRHGCFVGRQFSYNLNDFIWNTTSLAYQESQDLQFHGVDEHAMKLLSQKTYREQFTPLPLGENYQIVAKADHGKRFIGYKS